MKSKIRPRVVGAIGIAFSVAVGWHEAWGGSLASCTAAVLLLVSAGIILETVETQN